MVHVVMVIDDSATVRRQATRALVAAGFEVIHAIDGLDGLEKLAHRRDIVLVVCDMNMPRMDGVEFVESLARRGGTMPAFAMLTADGRPEVIRRAKAAGALICMTKPLKPEVLVALARSVAPLAG